MICVTDWVEYMVGKGENAGYQHFLLFPQCFLNASFPGSLKSGLCGKDLTHIPLQNNLLCSYGICVIYCHDV